MADQGLQAVVELASLVEGLILTQQIQAALLGPVCAIIAIPILNGRKMLLTIDLTIEIP